MPSSGSSDEYRTKAQRYARENRKTRIGVTWSRKVARVLDGSLTTPGMSADCECAVESIQARVNWGRWLSRDKSLLTYFLLRTAETANNKRTGHIRYMPWTATKAKYTGGNHKTTSVKIIAARKPCWLREGRLARAMNIARSNGLKSCVNIWDPLSKAPATAAANIRLSPELPRRAFQLPAIKNKVPTDSASTLMLNPTWLS